MTAKFSKIELVLKFGPIYLYQNKKKVQKSIFFADNSQFFFVFESIKLFYRFGQKKFVALKKMSESTRFSTKVEFMAGAENDFKELHDAIKDGKAGQNEFINDSSESSDNENLTNKSIQKSAADQDPASSSEEDETEPNPDQPGPRFLWAAQNDDRIEILKEILSKNPNVIKFADEDGYTALHRAAYSGSKVLKTELHTWKIKRDQ